MKNILTASVIASAALLSAVSCNDADGVSYENSDHRGGPTVGINTNGDPVFGINTGGGVVIDSGGGINYDTGGIMIPLG